MISFWVYVGSGVKPYIQEVQGFATQDEAQKYLDEVPIRRAELQAQIDEVKVTLAKLMAELAAL